MKKSILLLGAALSISAASFSQGFYLKVQGGYNFNGLQTNESLLAPRISASGTNIYTDALVTMANINEADSSYSPVKGSYGKGGNFSLGVGYMINHWFGVELGANYLWGSSISSTVVTQSTAGTTVVGLITGNVKAYSSGLSLSPALVFVASKPNWPVEPYAKVGLALPVYGVSKDIVDVDVPKNLVTDDQGNLAALWSKAYLGTKNHMELSTQGTVSLGVNWSIGVRYTPKNLPFITVYAESNGQWLNVRAKSTTITKYETLNPNTGQMVDRLHNSDASLNRPTYRTEFVYHDALNSNSNNANYSTNSPNPSQADYLPKNVDPNKPKDDIRPNAPFSNIGIQVGIQLNFGKEALASIKKKK